MSPADAAIRLVRDAASRLAGREGDLEGVLSGWDGALERLQQRRGVTVVIPVHNAAPQLDACLRSLAETAPRAELVLVDDRSTDPGIHRLYEREFAQRPNVRLVACERNAGFVTSVNAGLRAADPANDVVLLNSDTVTTPRWLDKLGVAAYAEADVASVTPLSNAAGVFSLPVEYEDNDLPEGMTPAMCAGLLEEVADREYPAIPAGSGFCLYLRRDAIDVLGLFDDFLLHRGYGEENDYCARALAAGFKNVVDDATFVFHEREASFQSAKTGLKERNSRLLKAMHPGHIEAMLAWLERTPLGAVRDRYAAALADGGGAYGEPVSTTVAVGESVAGWEGGRRVVTVRFERGRAEVNLFGIETVPVPVEDKRREAFVAYVANRWSASELAVADSRVDQRRVAAVTRST